MDKGQLRKKDFITAVLQLVVLGYLLWHTFGFPMKGSFGGVESQWYVSPALFPMSVLCILIICNLLLLVRSIQDKAHIKLWRQITDNADPSPRFHISTQQKQAAFIILSLLLYVYILIPSADFYLGTSLFLLTVSTHYVARNKAIKLHFTYWVLPAAALGVLVTRFWGEQGFYLLAAEANFDERLILLADSLLAGCCFLFVLRLVCLQETRKICIPIFITSLFVPLVVMIIFMFALQTPMPVEYGNVVQWLEYLYYDVLEM